MSKDFKQDEVVYSESGGMKCDKNKIKWEDAPWDLFEELMEAKMENPELRLDLVPAEPIIEVADILTYGAKKYEPNNWQKVELRRYLGALLRHWLDVLREKTFDTESKKRHSSHLVCNAVFINYIDKRDNDNGKNIKPKRTQKGN